MNYFNYINHKVSISLNNFVRENKLEKGVGLMADFPIFFLPVFLISTWLYWTFKNKNIEEKRKLIYIFFSIVFSIIINLIIQHLVHIKRPETLIEPILNHLPDASFPSDHAAVSFAFLVAIYLFGYKKIFWIFLPFVILMNVSRIAGGVHWFFDIIVGMLIGCLSAFIIWKNRKNKYLIKITDFILYIAKLLKL